MAEDPEQGETALGSTDGWGFQAYAAAQGKIYAETMAEALAWLRPLIVVMLSGLAILLTAFAYASNPNSFQQNLWIELAGGVAIFTGVAVFLCFGLRFGTSFRLLAFAAAIGLATLAYRSTGVTQQLLLGLGAGLIVLICVELWIEHLIKRVNSTIGEYEKQIDALEVRLEELKKPQQLQGL
jgi:hypothetical protein